MIESFWARMQTELLNRKKWRTRIELANAIFEYLEIFHNRQRRHSALGMRTPVEFELLLQSAQPVSEPPDLPGRVTQVGLSMSVSGDFQRARPTRRVSAPQQ